MSYIQTQPNMIIALSAALVILSAATLGYWLMRWVRPTPNLFKIAFHIRFWWVVMIFFTLAAVYSRNILLVFISFLSFLALKEFLSITPTRRADRRVLFWAYLSVPIQLVLVWNAWFTAFILFIPIYVFLGLPMLMVLVGETTGFLRACSLLIWGIMTNVFSLGHLAYLVVLPEAVNPVAGGLGYFLFLVILTQLNHMTQYIFGKLFDYPHLRLKVSTTRNWASLIGSIGSTALLAWLVAPILTPFSTLEAIVSGVLIAGGGFIGYTTMSAVKGDLRLRDRGSMLPGHGGVLNRIDLLIYNAPLFFYFVTYTQ